MGDKEAVVFILDANLTMNVPYPPHNDGEADAAGLKPCGGESSRRDGESTRLLQAKDAVLGSIVDYMWRSKTHETGLVVLKAGVTHHHLSAIDNIVDDVDIGNFFSRCGGGVKLERYADDAFDADGDVFPNLVEFDINRPTPHTLCAIKNVRCTINESTSSTVQGDFCDGIILAADALHRRTSGKKWRRKIVMITDAEHEVEVNGEQLQCVLEGLNKMEVRLIVVGIGFEEGVSITIDEEESDDDFDKKPDAVVSGLEGEDDVAIIKEEGNPDEIMKSDLELIKRENEKLLLSIARETNGSILTADGANLTEVLQTELPHLAGMKKSQRKKYDFRIAPGLAVVARGAKLTDKQTLPTTIKEAYQYHPETGEKLRDGNGELMTSPTRTLTEHFDDGNNIVPLDKRTDTYRYGSDLIPVGKMEILGINAAFKSSESIEMIGYLDRKSVVSSNLLMGPAYAITGGDSKKSRAAIAALSRALEETRKAGFCRVVRTENGDPKIGALLPRLDGRDDDGYGTETRGKGGRYLVFLQLPFADDLQHHVDMPVPLDSHGDYEDERVCDELIDSMMLPDDEFRSEEISFPALKAHHRLISHFAMNPLSPEEEMQEEGLAEERILEASRAKPLCEFDVVKTLSEKALKHIDAFIDNFTLVEHKPEDDKKERFWGDGISK